MGSTRKSTTTAVSTRSQAAYKAWETRREQAKRRSDAAKKAWRTRRANQNTNS